MAGALVSLWQHRRRAAVGPRGASGVMGRHAQPRRASYGADWSVPWGSWRLVRPKAQRARKIAQRARMRAQRARRAGLAGGRARRAPRSDHAPKRGPLGGLPRAAGVPGHGGPAPTADTARMVMAGTARNIGALGLVHIAHGTTRLADGIAAVRAAGGFIGSAVSTPLVAAVTPWVATPLLMLITGFGLLVITGTPLHRVRDRLAELAGFGRPGSGQAAGFEGDQAAAAGEAGSARGPLPRAGRRRQGATEAGAHDRP